MSKQQDPIVWANEATFAYQGAEGQRPALSDVTLEAAAGACIMLCGRSGCGKTTFTHLLNGLSPDFFAGELSGRVETYGLLAGDAAIEDYVPVVGSVFQNPKTQYFNVDTTAELAFPCENSGMEPEAIASRVHEVARDFGLEDLLGRSIFHLSGGEKQRIACGAAVMLEPRVLVLDEPTSNLDQAAIAELHDMVAKMKELGMTVVIAEHRLAWATDLVDQYFLFEGGRLAGTWGAWEFATLGEDRLASLGLRSLDLAPYRAKVAQRARASMGADELAGGGADQDRATRRDASQDAGQDTGQGAGKGTGMPRAERAHDGIAPLLATRRLTVGYDRKHPVREVDDLVLYDGEIVALMGHNGCGKSTLARTLCGLVRPLSGSVELRGHRAKPRELVRNSFLVMQDVNYQLFSDSVREEVLLGAREADACDEVLAALGLTELADRHPMSLSGGQKQRVAIASAMLSGKELVILDEPTSGLDRHHMERVGELLRQLASRGKCVLVITHDEELAATACDRVLMLDGTCGR